MREASLSMTPSEIRVAWVTAVLGVDGNLLYTDPLMKAFAAKLKNLRVFTGEFGGDAASFEVERCNSLRLYRNERKMQHGRTSYGGGLRVATPSVMRKLASYKPDLLILGEYSIFSLYGMLYSRIGRRRTPTLLVMEAKPRFPDFLVLGRARVLFRRLLVKGADAVLTNNVEGRQYLREVLHVPDHRIISEPFLVSDVSEASGASHAPARRREHTGSRPVRFVYVGQLIPRKGLAYALTACAKLLPKYAGRFVYEIVGDGPSRAELEEQASSLGLGGHIVFRGRQRYEELSRFYAQADVLLFPTLADYRSLVPFEALSSGLPILASLHDGGISETVHEGTNGFAFDPRNAEQLADRMSRFIEDPRLVGSFSARSLEMATNYTLPRAVDTLLKACDLAFARA
jgi:glycosyltransferase involved in cell wall biosynthesis